jgi:hypothetical protein
MRVRFVVFVLFGELERDCTCLEWTYACVRACVRHACCWTQRPTCVSEIEIEIEIDLVLVLVSAQVSFFLLRGQVLDDQACLGYVRVRPGVSRANETYVRRSSANSLTRQETAH